MTTESIAAALALAFSCVLCASCLQADETALRPSTATAPPASEPAEPTGEARDAWTRAECQEAFVRNTRWCETWTVKLRPTCLVVIAGMHIACVKEAED